MSEKEKVMLKKLTETAKQLPAHAQDVLTAYAQGVADGCKAVKEGVTDGNAAGQADSP